MKSDPPRWGLGASDRVLTSVRSPAGSKLDPFRAWTEAQLQSDPRVPLQRLRELAVELGYEGDKTIFDDFVREVRPLRARPPE